MGRSAKVITAGLILALAGCANQQPSAAPNSTASAGAVSNSDSAAPTSPPRVVELSTNEQNPLYENDLVHGSGRDAAPAVRQLFRIDVYQFTAPLGSLGRNETFWRRIDEQCVDVGTYDLLFKNGVRVGVAPMSEFPAIRKFIDSDATCRVMSVTGTVAKQVQLESRKEVVDENIFEFNAANEAVGRTYERCTNFMNLSFEPTPRKPGSVRVKLCPMVRSTRAHLEFTLLNEEREFEWVVPEELYDLNLRVDIPPDSFFIVAPSTDADRLTSVGHAFFTQDGSTERLEQVIALVPLPLNAADPLTPPSRSHHDHAEDQPAAPPGARN
jgi:hypothetical protein